MHPSHHHLPPYKGFFGNTAEYKGIYKALTEAHYNFDVILATELDKADLSRYKTVLFPGEDPLHPDTVTEGGWDAETARRVLSRFRPDANLIATGSAFVDQPEQLKALFGGEQVRTEEKTAGAYFLTDDKQLFRRLPETHWVLADGPFHCIRCENGAMPYMAPGVYGPVEIAGGTFPSEYYGMGIKKEAGHTNVLLPWNVGKLYEENGFTQHRDILLDALEMVGCRPIDTDAHDSVQLFYDGCEGGRILQLINLSGMNGVTVHAPIPMRNVHITIPANGADKAINLRTDEPLPVRVENGQMTVTLPELGNFGAILIPEA